MKNYKCGPYFKSVLVKGMVCYEDGKPVKNAKVVLEALLFDEYDKTKLKYNRKYCGCIFTDDSGEFCCLVYDTKCYYKLKVFKDEVLKCEINNIDNAKCNIYLG